MTTSTLDNRTQWSLCILNWIIWVLMLLGTIKAINTKDAYLMSLSTWIFCALVLWELKR